LGTPPRDDGLRTRTNSARSVQGCDMIHEVNDFGLFKVCERPKACPKTRRIHKPAFKNVLALSASFLRKRTFIRRSKGGGTIGAQREETNNVHSQHRASPTPFQRPD
jgi:hypothetical protein